MSEVSTRVRSAVPQNEILNLFKDMALEGRTFLSGSRAVGLDHAYSDLDIIVETKGDETWEPLMAFIAGDLADIRLCGQKWLRGLATTDATEQDDDELAGPNQMIVLSRLHNVVSLDDLRPATLLTPHAASHLKSALPGYCSQLAREWLIAQWAYDAVADLAGVWRTSVYLTTWLANRIAADVRWTYPSPYFAYDILCRLGLEDGSCGRLLRELPHDVQEVQAFARRAIDLAGELGIDHHGELVPSSGYEVFIVGDKRWAVRDGSRQVWSLTDEEVSFLETIRGATVRVEDLKSPGEQRTAATLLVAGLIVIGPQPSSPGD
jgi:hypothetical protein